MSERDDAEAHCAASSIAASGVAGEAGGGAAASSAQPAASGADAAAAAAAPLKRGPGRPRKNPARAPRSPVAAWYEATDEGPETERRNPASANFDQLPTLGMLVVMNDEDQKVAPAVRRALREIAAAVNLAVEAISRGGRVIYAGAGTSGRIALLDAAECPPTFNVAPGTVQAIIAGGLKALSRATESSEDNPADAVAQLTRLRVGSRDLVIGLAASGRTPFTLEALRQARRVGARTVAVVCDPTAPMLEAADVGIVARVGPEVIAGSSRLKAGAAQKMVLNMISTATMARLGYVFGNEMINVRPTNAKLAARAERMVSRGADVPATRARTLLKVAEGDARVALLMGLKHISVRAARAALAANRNSLRLALTNVADRTRPARR